MPESDQLRPVQIFTGARQRNAATERCYGTLLTNSLGQLTSSARPTLPGIRPDGYVFRAAVTRF